MFSVFRASLAYVGLLESCVHRLPTNFGLFPKVAENQNASRNGQEPPLPGFGPDCGLNNKSPMNHSNHMILYKEASLVPYAETWLKPDIETWIVLHCFFSILDMFMLFSLYLSIFVLRKHDNCISRKACECFCLQRNGQPVFSQPWSILGLGTFYPLCFFMLCVIA